MGRLANSEQNRGIRRDGNVNATAGKLLGVNRQRRGTVISLGGSVAGGKQRRARDRRQRIWELVWMEHTMDLVRRIVEIADEEPGFARPTVNG